MRSHAFFPPARDAPSVGEGGADPRTPDRSGRIERRTRMNIAVVVGNPKANSRTLRVALAVADTLSARLGVANERLVVDLAEVATELFDPEGSRVNDLLDDVASSDLIIVASPTFKATYTGLLKSFFDRYTTNALSAAVAVGVMTGAAPVHALAVEVHLRPLLVELGASTPTRGLYVTEQQFGDLDAAIGGWADGASPLIAQALA
jgi:FMN reductase